MAISFFKEAPYEPEVDGGWIAVGGVGEASSLSCP